MNHLKASELSIIIANRLDQLGDHSVANDFRQWAVDLRIIEADQSEKALNPGQSKA